MKKMSEEQKVEHDVAKSIMGKAEKLPKGLLSNMTAITSLGVAISTASSLNEINGKLDEVLELLKGKKRSSSQEESDSTWEGFKRYIESHVPVGSGRFLRALEESGIDCPFKLFAQGSRTLLMGRRNFAAKSAIKLRGLAHGFFGRYPW